MKSQKQLRIKNNPDLVRDSFSKAIINIDRNGFAQYKERKKLLSKKENEIQNLKSEIEKIKQDYETILLLIKDINKTK